MRCSGPRPRSFQTKWLVRVPSGLATVECHGLLEFSYGPPVLLGTTFGYSAGVAADGRYTLDCRASDQLGNAGVGDGSTAMPIELRIDRTAPTVTCPRHRTAVTAHDVAGNTTTTNCTYVVRR